MPQPTSLSLRAFFILFLGSLFYGYEFFLRVAPSVLSQHLMLDFHMDAAVFGLTSAAFYYAYTPMQIPAGLLGDHFGPKKIMVTAMCLCSLATLAYASTQQLAIFVFARFITGFSSSFAYIGPLMLASTWFPKRYFPAITGCIQTIGCLGAIFGEEVIANSAEHIGWRPTLLIMGGAGFIIFILYLIFLENSPTSLIPSPRKTATNALKINEWQRFRIVIGQNKNWVIAFLGLASWAPMAVLAELWGIPYLEVKHHISPEAATQIVLWIWIGTAVSSPIIGWISSIFMRRKALLLIAFAVTFITSSLLFYTELSPLAEKICFFTLGSASAAQCLTFALIHDNNHPKQLGTAIGFNNMAVIAGAMLLQPLVGFVLRFTWSGLYSQRLPLYTIVNYQYAFSCIPALALLGLLASIFLLQETLSYSKDQENFIHAH
jgi:MFS family permease